jgi:hypothetical protein
MSEIIDLSNIKNTEIDLKIKFESNKNDFSLINFYDESNNKKELLASEATKNILVTGATGSGKTTSVLLPMINSLIQHNCPGLILDIKSDLFSHIYTIANNENKLDNILFVGTYEFCQKINILASVKNVNQLKNVLNSIKTNSDNDMSYWWQSGVDDVMDIVMVHEWLMTACLEQEYSYSFNNIFDYINKSGYAKNIIDKADDYATFAPEEIISLINKIKTEPFSLYNITARSDSDDARQKMWRSGQVSNVIAPFIKKPFSDQFGDVNETTTIHDYIYKQGKIIVLVMPIEHESVGHTLGKLIREIFFKSVLSNNASERYNYIIGKEHNRYTFLLIDEYQFFVNSKGNNGVVTDESWVSISRSYGNINIFATQSITSLISKTKSEIDIETIHQNCVNEIYLPTKDRRTLDYISYFSDENNIDMNIIKNPKPNTRIGICRLSNNGGVDNIIFNSSKANEYSKYHTNDYISLKIKNETNLLTATHEKEHIKIDNAYIIYTDNKSVKLSNSKKLVLEDFYSLESIQLSLKEFQEIINDPRLYNIYQEFLRTPNNININAGTLSKLTNIIKVLSKYRINLQKNIYHSKFQDLLNSQDMNQYVSFLHANNRYPNFQIYTYPKSKARSDISSTSIHIPEDVFVSIIDVLKVAKKIDDESTKNLLFKKEIKLIDNLKRSKFICITRGGGDFLSNDFDHFKNTDIIKFIRNTNPDAIIFTALSHAHDSFLVDLFSDYSFITPTAFAAWADNMIRTFNSIK